MTSQSCVKLIRLKMEMISNVEIRHLSLGSLVINSFLSREELGTILAQLGFEIIRDDEQILVEKTKIAAIELIHFANNSNSLIRNSDYLSDRVQCSYSKISKSFSKVTGVTIEKYIILLKIEKVKILLLEEDYSLSEISYYLGYNSVQYLSRQFKSITGYTVSEYKELKTPPRKLLNQII